MSVFILLMQIFLYFVLILTLSFLVLFSSSLITYPLFVLNNHNHTDFLQVHCIKRIQQKFTLITSKKYHIYAKQSNIDYTIFIISFTLVM